MVTFNVDYRQTALAVGLLVGDPKVIGVLARVCRRLRQRFGDASLCCRFGEDHNGCWNRIVYYDYVPWSRQLCEHVVLNRLCRRRRAEYCRYNKKHWIELFGRETVHQFLYAGRLLGLGYGYKWPDERPAIVGATED